MGEERLTLSQLGHSLFSLVDMPKCCIPLRMHLIEHILVDVFIVRTDHVMFIFSWEFTKVRASPLINDSVSP